MKVFRDMETALVSRNDIALWGFACEPCTTAPLTSPSSAADALIVDLHGLATGDQCILEVSAILRYGLQCNKDFLVGESCIFGDEYLQFGCSL